MLYHSQQGPNECVRLGTGEVNCLRYNPHLNKKAKKRLKESVQIEIAERNPQRNEQGTSIPPKKLPENQKFTPRPDKKRG
jgi:hypothetical protein